MKSAEGDEIWMCPHCGGHSVDSGQDLITHEVLDGVPERIRSDQGRLQKAKGGMLVLNLYYCSICYRPTITGMAGTFQGWSPRTNGPLSFDGNENVGVIWPPYVFHQPVHEEVPSDITREIVEARRVVGHSPNACVVLCRRALQVLFRTDSKVTPQFSLKVERQQFIEGKTVDDRISRALEVLTDIGAVGAHPGKDGVDIINIDDTEARKALDLLWEVVCHFYPSKEDREGDPLEVLDQARKKKYGPPRRRP